MKQLDYDDSRLQQLFAELEPKRRLQALRGAFRKEADRVRKVAINNLRGSGLRSSKELEKGIRRIVNKNKKKAGFRVTVGTKRANKAGKGEAGFHTNRRGLKKPILIWAEDGTQERKTKNGGGILGFFTRRAARKRRAHRTGKMKRYGFMSRTLEGTRESVTNNVRNNVVESIKKIAEKYGCKS